MQLQERDREIQALVGALGLARQGQGRAVAILGEAGMGKTTLLRAFLEVLPKDTRLLWGACEDLSIAEPLGPLRDLAREAGWQIEEALAAPGGRIAAFSQVLSAIDQTGQATVVVIEDLHWADEATVDFLRFLTRRLDRRRILLVVTARGEDARGKANIRQLASGVHPEAFLRLEVAPLTLHAVRALAAGTGLDPQAIFRITGGNAFYVSEVTKFGLGAIPLSVEDAVLARLDTATEDARKLAEVVSIFPRRAEVALLKSLLAQDIDAAMDQCLRSGLLRHEDDHLSFPHEIARLAVEKSLPAALRKRLNLACLQLLEQAGPGQAARRLHHAQQGGDPDTIRKLAPEAAEEAMQIGAARTASNYYDLALRYWTPGDQADEAGFLVKAAWAHFLTGQSQRPIELGQRALAIFQALGDPLGEGDCHRRLAQFHWMRAEVSQAVALADRAVRTLHQHRGPNLAMALTTQAQLAMLDKRYSQVLEPARQAIDLAREFNRPDIESHALNNLSQAVWLQDLALSRQMIRDSIAIGLRMGDAFNVGRGYANFTFLELDLLNFTEAESLALKAIDYSAEHEQEGLHDYVTGALAWIYLRQGRWDEAKVRADTSFDTTTAVDEQRIGFVPAKAFTGACAQIWLAARQGQPIPPNALEYLQRFMRGADELQRLNIHAALQAELAWLGHRDRDLALDQLRKVVARAEDLTVVADSAIWLKRLDPASDISALSDVVLPYRLEGSGDIAGAATEWDRRGAPFDQAMALAFGSAEQRLEAIRIFQRIGASAIVGLLSQDLQSQGLVAAPSKPRLSTLQNPLGLTTRQMDVLRALAEGLSNQDIGRKLFVSAKTVDHHVSAILAKLEVSNRGEAAAKARRLSLI